MYDRAARKFNFQAATGTDETLGPGVYDTLVVSKSKIRADGYAPFGSLSTRDHFMTPADAVIAAPGPGQYDPQVEGHVVGGSSLVNRARRFGSGKTTHPGPGTYNLASKWIKEERYSTADVAKDKSGAMTVTSRVKYQRKADAPSIPMPGQAYGYEEAEDGSLIRQEAPNNDRTLGPAYYANAGGEDTVTTRRYRGCHWSKARTGRSDFTGKPGPGPGDYDPFLEQESAPKLIHVNMTKEGSKPHELKIPRYSDAVVEKAVKGHIPGPGAYDVRGVFDPAPPKVNQEGLEVERPPFGSQARRFDAGKLGNPGPGAYNDPRHALSVVNRTTGLKRSPFGQTSVRFHEDNHRRMPGPGAYRVTDGIGSRSERQTYMSSFRRGAFGSTASRTQPAVRKGDVDLPGPASYTVQDKPNKQRYGQLLTAPFASLTTRNPDPPEEREKPAPGCYDVAKSFEVSQGQKRPRPPRTDHAKKRNQSFVSAADRFAAAKDSEVPGPGTYELKGRHGIGGRLTGREARFKDIPEEGPGPAHYELSPLLANTVLKGTYNATLNNPLLDGVDKGYGLSPSKQSLAVGV